LFPYLFFVENVDKLKETLKQMREEGIPFGEEKSKANKTYNTSYSYFYLYL
jgi:hypothetical protein